MLRSDSEHVQQLCDLAESSVQIGARVHEILDVVDDGEIELQQREKVVLLAGQRRAGENLEQVAEVEAGVEADPLDFLVEHDAGSHQPLAEISRVDAVLLVRAEVNARLGQQVDTVLRIRISAQAELEVKLLFSANKAKQVIVSAFGAGDRVAACWLFRSLLTCQVHVPG